MANGLTSSLNGIFRPLGTTPPNGPIGQNFTSNPGNTGINPSDSVEISNKDYFKALNIPNGLSTASIDVNGLVPGLGDNTGITVQAANLATAGIYTQIQRTFSIINYLNTSPEGTKPNPEFSYIKGRPSYANDTPEGKRLQAEVYTKLRTNIIAQLTRLAEQLQATAQGLETQKNLAETFGRQQTETIKSAVTRAFQGGGQGGGGGGG